MWHKSYISREGEKEQSEQREKFLEHNRERADKDSARLCTAVQSSMDKMEPSDANCPFLVGVEIPRMVPRFESIHYKARGEILGARVQTI